MSTSCMSLYAEIGKKYWLQVLTHKVGLFHCRLMFHIACMPYSCCQQSASYGGIVQTIKESLKRVYSTQHVFTVTVCRCGYEVEFLVVHFGITAAATVYQGLHLCRHSVEIYRRCHYYNICRDHCCDDLCGIVLLRTRLSAVTYAASGTVADRFVAQEYLFRIVPGLCGST